MGISGSDSCSNSGSVSCKGISGCCILQGKDLSLELKDEGLSFASHVIRVFVGAGASSDDSGEIGGAVMPWTLLSQVAIDRSVKDR